eukprot:TRINITY_DN3626_c1_g1_i3.p1 TRINITY_DN3626_c1_g1~~TRINITY_DN3626_c1_g1_i3.p1  ORF type:complete len:1029 (+),score=110.24 TRINITY_DN3626_c1_g1_i3:286-3372(+)
MTCVAGKPVLKTRSMDTRKSDAVSASVTKLYHRLPKYCNSTTCPQADWAGCVLRMAGHDFMDFDPIQSLGGSDGCIDFDDADNKGLDKCLYLGEFHTSLLEAYQEHCLDVSLADFFVISAEAIMSTMRPANTSSIDFRSQFRFGRVTAPSCTTLPALPDAERGCGAVKQTFVNQMGLTWRDSAALMGVHSIGRAQKNNSGYNGWWSDPENSRLFNNNYYASLIAKGWRAGKPYSHQDYHQYKHLFPDTNPGRTQWVRFDLHGGQQEAHRHEMMLNTDMCLAYANHHGQPVLASRDECCAWVPVKEISWEVKENISGNSDGSFCGKSISHWQTQFIRENHMQCCGRVRFPHAENCGNSKNLFPTKLGGPAEFDVFEFAASESVWLSAFLAAWKRATENGQEESLRSLHRMDDPTAASSTTTTTIDTTCFEHAGHYKPVDMNGQSRTSEATANACQQRCASVTGCAHFSWWRDGGCHLQDSNATWQHNSEATAGSPTCTNTTIDMTIDTTCFEDGVNYEPVDMNEQSRTSEATANACQQRCASVTGCAHFSYWWRDRNCRLQDSNATWQQNFLATAGSPTCMAIDTTTTTTIDTTCFEHAHYKPVDMNGQSRTSEATANACQQRCASVTGCAHFSWWRDGGCHLQDSNATWQQNFLATAGSPTCATSRTTTTARTFISTTVTTTTTSISTSTTLTTPRLHQECWNQGGCKDDGAKICDWCGRHGGSAMYCCRQDWSQNYHEGHNCHDAIFSSGGANQHTCSPNSATTTAATTTSLGSSTSTSTSITSTSASTTSILTEPSTSTTTTTAPSTSKAAGGFSSVDGSNHACRGASASDNSAEFYELFRGMAGVEDCKAQCIQTHGCVGIEFNSSGRCEVWKRPEGIGATAKVMGFECFRYTPDIAGSTSTTTTVSGFTAADGGENRACRGATPTDNSAKYYELYKGVFHLEACKALCVGTRGCVGIEYKVGRCEVWRRSEGIGATAKVLGFRCLRYEPTMPVMLQESRLRHSNRSRRGVNSLQLKWPGISLPR